MNLFLDYSLSILRILLVFLLRMKLWASRTHFSLEEILLEEVDLIFFAILIKYMIVLANLMIYNTILMHSEAHTHPQKYICC